MHIGKYILDYHYYHYHCYYYYCRSQCCNLGDQPDLFFYYDYLCILFKLFVLPPILPLPVYFFLCELCSHSVDLSACLSPLLLPSLLCTFSHCVSCVHLHLSFPQHCVSCVHRAPVLTMDQEGVLADMKKQSCDLGGSG